MHSERTMSVQVCGPVRLAVFAVVGSALLMFLFAFCFYSLGSERENGC